MVPIHVGAPGSGYLPPVVIEECLVVEFAITGDDCPLAAATAAVGTTVECHLPLYRGNDTALLRFSATENVNALASALNADKRIEYLHVSDSERGSNFRCLSTQPCVLRALVEAGFLAESIEYRAGRGVFSGGVVGYEVLHSVLQATEDAVGVTVEQVYPLASSEDELVREQWAITPAQEEALRTAVAMGYVAVPRRVTAGDVADELGISKSAFLERLHRGEHHVLSRIFG